MQSDKAKEDLNVLETLLMCLYSFDVFNVVGKSS